MLLLSCLILQCLWRGVKGRHHWFFLDSRAWGSLGLGDSGWITDHCVTGLSQWDGGDGAGLASWSSFCQADFQQACRMQWVCFISFFQLSYF